MRQNRCNHHFAFWRAFHVISGDHFNTEQVISNLTNQSFYCNNISQLLLTNTEPHKAEKVFSKLRKCYQGLTKMPVEAKTTLKFTRLSENAFPPVKGSEKAAGFDLKSAYDYTVPARGKELIKTDLKIELPSGCYGRVAPRSGLAVKNFIDVGAGVIDEDYRGNVGVVLFNHSDQEFTVKKGDRIAQLICERIFYPVLLEVSNLSDTDRSDKGFGSTGTQ